MVGGVKLMNCWFHMEKICKIFNVNLNLTRIIKLGNQAIQPQAAVQLCVVQMVCHSLNYVSWKMRKAVPLFNRLNNFVASFFQQFAVDWLNNNFFVHLLSMIKRFSFLWKMSLREIGCIHASFWSFAWSRSQYEISTFMLAK